MKEGERKYIIPWYLETLFFNYRIVPSVVTSLENSCLRISSNLHNRVGVLTALFKSVECVLGDDDGGDVDDRNAKD